MVDRVRALYDNRIIRGVAVALLAILAAISVYQGICNALTFSQDFQWDASRALMLGIDPYRESLLPTGALQTGNLKDYYSYYESIDAPQKMEANQFPSLLMLLYPYALLAPDTARTVWLITNLLWTAGILVLLRLTFLKDCDRFLFILLSLLMLAGTPYRNQLGVGQHTLFSLFFFLLALWFSEKKWGMIPSALSLTVGLFKYTLTAPLALYFVYKRKWGELTIAAAIHAALTVVASIRLKEPLIDMILMPVKVSGALASEGGLDFGALFGGSATAFVLAAIVFCGLFFLALKTKAETEKELMSVLLLWSLIMLYHRTYDYFPLVMVAACFCTEGKNEERSETLMKILYIVVLCGVFFVLRLFHEALLSRICIGILYYAFTVLMTLRLIKRNGMNRHEITGET